MHEHNHESGHFKMPHWMHGLRGGRFGFGEHRHHGFGMPPHWHTEPEDSSSFAQAAEEDRDSMLGDERKWRGGGPRGRNRPDFGFGRGPGRGERPLEQGDLRWLVLDLIAAQSRHGYEIIKAIEEMMGGHYSPSPGVIYPTLTFLEDTGLISSESQATKKLYCITDEGRATLKANASAIAAMKVRIAEARQRFGAPPAPEMARAMGNLRAAIQVRLSKGELSTESLASVTAALDRAASEIERS